MKSIFSTQNLQTFFLRKYWRLPRRGPPGPPGPPPGPPSRRGPCPPPGPCPPGRGPLGADDCLCSSAIAAYLSRNLRSFSTAFGARCVAPENVAAKPCDLGNDRGYRSDGARPAPTVSWRLGRSTEPLPGEPTALEPPELRGLWCGADDGLRGLRAWPGISSGA